MNNYCKSCKYVGKCDKEWRYSNLTYPCEEYRHEQTNEEWLKCLPRKELAYELTKMIHTANKSEFNVDRKWFETWLGCIRKVDKE